MAFIQLERYEAVSVIKPHNVSMSNTLFLNLLSDPIQQAPQGTCYGLV